MRNDKKSVEAEIQAFGNVNATLKKRAESLKAEVEAKKKKFKEVSAAQKALIRKKEKLAGEVKVLTEEINTRRATVSDFEEKSRERKMKIDALTEQVHALTAQIETTENHTTHIRHTGVSHTVVHGKTLGFL